MLFVVLSPLLKEVCILFCKVKIIFVASAITSGDAHSFYDCKVLPKPVTGQAAGLTGHRRLTGLTGHSRLTKPTGHSRLTGYSKLTGHSRDTVDSLDTTDTLDTGDSQDSLDTTNH